MKFNVGDKVVVIKVEAEYGACLGKIGKIVDIDPDWEFPYEVELEDGELREAQEMGQMQELFGEDEIELEAVVYEAKSTPQTIPYRNEKIENNFSYHAPKKGQPEKYEIIREKAKELAYIIDALCPDSREKSVAMTELETAVFWANASIARN